MVKSASKDSEFFLLARENFTEMDKKGLPYFGLRNVLGLYASSEGFWRHVSTKAAVSPHRRRREPTELTYSVSLRAPTVPVGGNQETQFQAHSTLEASQDMLSLALET